MTNINRTLTKTERNLWNAIVSEAMAHLKYSAYAHKALEEGHPEVAQIFQEVAGAETIHGMNHLKVTGEVKSSLENLRTVISGESKEISTMYPRYVKDALDEGRSDAADTFIMAMDREQHHLEVFSKAAETLEAKTPKRAEAERPFSSDVAVATEEKPRAVEPDVSPSYTHARKEVAGERWRVAAVRRVREVVFGAQDGLVSIVALVTAVAVAGADNTIVLIAGLAGALSGMISMATGAYLGSKAEQEVQRAEIAQEAQELEEHPAEELAELVVLYQREGMSFKEAQSVADHISTDKDLWLQTLVEKELGLSAVVTSNPIKDAATMGAAFSIGAALPIIPFFFADGKAAITASVAAALTGLFVLGVGKGRVVRKSPLFEGVLVLLIGAASAAVGFALGQIA